jgi:hypothetical protein
MEPENKRHAPSRNKLRSLKQYREMPEEEFSEAYSQLVFGASRDSVIREKYDRLMKQFEEEYDLSEMLPNDRVILKNLINAMLQLEDYEAQLMLVSKEGFNNNNIVIVRELNNVCKALRNDISEMQDDLGITRKSRKNDKEASVLNTIEDLKKKAQQFYQQKMQYIICENCGTLLATVWWMKPEDVKSKIVVHCTRILDDDKQCNFTKAYTAKEILEMGGSNRKELLPESVR